MKTNRQFASSEMLIELTSMMERMEAELKRCSSAYVEFKEEIQIARVDVIEILDEVSRLLTQMTQPLPSLPAESVASIRLQLDHLKRRTEKCTRG
jgi:hypothetical protein